MKTLNIFRLITLFKILSLNRLSLVRVVVTIWTTSLFSFCFKHNSGKRILGPHIFRLMLILREELSCINLFFYSINFCLFLQIIFKKIIYIT